MWMMDCMTPAKLDFYINPYIIISFMLKFYSKQNFTSEIIYVNLQLHL